MSDNIVYNIVKECDTGSLIRLYKIAGWWKLSDKASDVPKVVSNSFCFLIAIKDGEIIGTARVISDGVTDAYIQDVVVDPRFRKLGIGKEIVKRLVSFCLERKVYWIALIAEPGTADFYQPIGFKPMQNYLPMKYSND